jgi:F-type H+-transporting ATPase subunit b
MATAMQEGTTEPAGEHQAGGLPQFDFTWWAGEIVWFLILFVVALLFVRFFVTPRLGGAIEAREDHISAQIAEARRMKEQADAEAEAAAAEAAQARASAQRVALEARAKAQAEAAARLAEEEAKLAATATEAEKRITASRDKAMTNVSAIAVDAAAAIVQQLTGKAATASELASVKG